MDKVPDTEELQCTGELLQEMADDDFMQTASPWIWVLCHHVPHIYTVSYLLPPLDELGQVTKSDVLHDQVDVLGCFLAVDEGSDMRVVEALEDRYLGGQVVLQLLVELSHVNGLDCNQGFDARRILLEVSIHTTNRIGAKLRCEWLCRRLRNYLVQSLPAS